MRIKFTKMQAYGNDYVYIFTEGYNIKDYNTLAKRIFLSDNYSDSDFVDFYQQYLDNKSDVSSYLLDSFEDTTKRNLLIYLCFQNDEFENKEKLERSGVRYIEVNLSTIQCMEYGIDKKAIEIMKEFI